MFMPETDLQRVIGLLADQMIDEFGRVLEVDLFCGEHEVGDDALVCDHGETVSVSHVDK